MASARTRQEFCLNVVYFMEGPAQVMVGATVARPAATPPLRAGRDTWCSVWGDGGPLRVPSPLRRRSGCRAL
jgi:hypothetical protein